MRRLLLIPILLWCTSAMSAELLIQAVDSPFEDGAKKGDIIVVRPDGWVWGTSECLPQYVVVKMAGVTEEYAKKYEESLTEQVAKVAPMVNVAPVKGGKILEAPVEDLKIAPQEMTSNIVRARKYSIPREDVDAMISKEESVAVKSPSYFVAEKSLAVEKMAVMEAVALKEMALE
jgi:hypothetical protein